MNLEERAKDAAEKIVNSDTVQDRTWKMNAYGEKETDWDIDALTAIIESAMAEDKAALLEAVGNVVKYTERSDFASHEDCQENARDIEGWLTALRRLAAEYKKAKGE